MLETKIQDKLIFFEAHEDSKKKLELKDKILPLVSGYTLNQIRYAFKYIESDLQDQFIINLED